MQLNFPKAAGALLAFFAATFHSAPMLATTLPAVALWFIIIDWGTGITAAALRRDATGQREISSSEMRLKLRSKLNCYAMIIGLGVGFAVITQSWNWYIAAWGAVAMSEAWSILENLRSAATAPELAPVRMFAERAAQFIRSFTQAKTGASPSNDKPTKDETDKPKA